MVKTATILKTVTTRDQQSIFSTCVAWAQRLTWLLNERKVISSTCQGREDCKFNSSNAVFWVAELKKNY